MRNPLIPSLLLALSVVLWPSALAAQVVVGPADGAREVGAPVRTLAPLEVRGGEVNEKADEPAEVLFVPFFFVDTADPSGTTTLFAVRNVLGISVDIEIRYFSPVGDLLQEELKGLSAGETYTLNIRDIEGLSQPESDFAVGYVEVARVNGPRGGTGASLVGDFFQVNVGENFATGDRMISSAELCEQQEVRILDFGSGTTLRFFLRDPQGTAPSDDPSVRVRVLAEDGSVVEEEIPVRTAHTSFAVSSALFTDEDFGTMVFDFFNSGGGYRRVQRRGPVLGGPQQRLPAVFLALEAYPGLGSALRDFEPREVRSRKPSGAHPRPSGRAWPATSSTT